MTSSLSPNRYEIAGIDQWLNGWATDLIYEEDARRVRRRVTLPLVDLRSYDDFNERHLSALSKVVISDATAKRGVADAEDIADTNIKDAMTSTAVHNDDVTVVNLPLSTLLSGERSCELPPRHVEFALLIPAQFTQEFRESDDCSIKKFFFATQSKSTMASRMPWLVRQVLLDDRSLWQAANDIGLARCGKYTRVPRPRLWKPDPLIDQEILPLIKEWMLGRGSCHSDKKKAVNMASDEPTPKDISTGLVLDLGSGSGRDICYLAEELTAQSQQNPCQRSIKFVGIDNHKGSAKRCLPLWTNRGVDNVTSACNIDLNKLHQVRDHFMDVPRLFSRPPASMKEPTILCIFAIRFLNRRLFSYIANSQSMHVAPAVIAPVAIVVTAKKAMHMPPPPLVLPLGTLVAISHFCKPHDGASWNFDHPKEVSVLNRWELKCMFGDDVCEETNGEIDKKWQILKDEIISDGDHGRTLIQFVARKVA